MIDPLLEKGKEKWNKEQAKRQKRETEWGSASGGGGGARDEGRQRLDQRQWH